MRWGGLEFHIQFEQSSPAKNVSLLQAPELLMNVNFEPIIRGLKSDIIEV